MKKILYLFIAVLISISAGAQKWYVATTGSDASGNGTVLRPWLTVDHALDTITTANGFTTDTVFIAAGDYDESTNQLVKSVGISIMGVMNATDTTHITSSYVGATYAFGSIQCVSTAGTSTNDNSSISYIKLSGSNLTATTGIYIAYRNNVEIHHCVVEDFLHAGISINASQGLYPDLYLTGHSVHDCTIDNSSGLGSGWYHGNLRLQGTSGALVYNNIFDNRSRPTGENANSMLLWRNKGTKTYNNTFYRNDHEITAGGVHYWNFFFEEWNYRGGSEFYNNTLYGLAKLSLGGNDNQVVAGYSYGYKVYNNQFINAANGNRSYNGGTQTI
jgi:hypothetical protein